MGLYTKFLKLFKYDPEIDRKSTFNITKALNENWDKIDSKVKGIQENKADKVEGKQLSTEDYTTEEKQKLDRIEAGATKYKHPSKHPANMITQDSTHRFVTDTEESTWNNKETPAGAQKKADEVQEDLDIHKADNTKHITANERAAWDSKPNSQRLVSDSVSSTSSTTAASSRAVKTAYDKGKEALNKANGNSSQMAELTEDLDTHKSNNVKHITAAERSAWNAKPSSQRAVSSSVTSTSTSTAGSSKAVKTAYDKAKDAYSKVTSAPYLRDKLKTVDGSGSNLDADTVDGKHANDFQSSNIIYGHVEYADNIGPLKTLTKYVPIGSGKTQGRLSVNPKYQITRSDEQKGSKGVLILFTTNYLYTKTVGVHTGNNAGVISRRWAGFVTYTDNHSTGIGSCSCGNSSLYIEDIYI